MRQGRRGQTEIRSVRGFSTVVVLSSHLASLDELLEDQVALLCNGDSAGDVFFLYLGISNVSLF